MIKRKFIILISLILFVSILIYIRFFPYIIIDNEENNKLFESYNMKLIQFENEMNDIAIGDNEIAYAKWNLLKNRNYESGTLQLYDYIIQHLNNCYLYATDDGTNITYSNYISKFSNKKRINKNDLENYMKGYEINNEACLKKFSNIKVFISGNDDVLSLINEFDTYYNNIKNKEFKNYKELLQTETKKIDLMLKVTHFLKNDI